MAKGMGRKATRLVDGRPSRQVTDQTRSVHASPASEDGPNGRCETERQGKQRATQYKDNPNHKHIPNSRPLAPKWWRKKTLRVDWTRPWTHSCVNSSFR